MQYSSTGGIPGEECPLCRAGTISLGEDRLLCVGECGGLLPMRNGYIWVIRATGDIDVDEDDQPLYWSNDDGWCDRATADVFNEDERLHGLLPIAGRWEELA